MLAHFDVIVVGGGLAGVCAALAAARHGARTLLAESLPFIGGNGTIGLPMTTFRASYSPPVIVGGIPREILERLRESGGFDSNPEQEDWMPMDCDLLQLVLTRLLDESGITLLCHSPLHRALQDSTRLRHVVFLDQDRLGAYEGKCFVDTSGDAALAFQAGLDTPMGRARDGRTQPMTLTFSVANIDTEAFLHSGGCRMLAKKWSQARAKVPFRNPRLGSALSCPTFIPGRRGEASFNVTRILVDKGLGARQLTDAEREGRYQVEEFVERFLRPHVHGFEHCWLSHIAHRVGVRETRRIRGEYELQIDDLLTRRRFEDAVACNSYPVDIHSPTGGDTEFKTESIPVGDYYTIPYRSLVAGGIDNLLAAGRCISASHEAIAAVRVLSCAMATGQAAGTAAALCAAKNIPARNLNPSVLRGVLREDGAIVD